MKQGICLCGNHKRLRYLILMVGVMGVIFWFSAQPAVESQALSDGFMDWLLDGRVPVLSWLAEVGFFEWFSLRKCAHACVYFTLGTLAALFVGTWDLTQGKQMVYPWLISVLYAGFDELHQAFVPGRSCELRDVCIDGTGALVGVLLVFLLGSYQKHKKKK